MDTGKESAQPVPILEPSVTTKEVFFRQNKNEQ